MAHSEHALGNGPLDEPVSSHMGTSAQYREFATMRMEFQTETERHRRILKEMAEAWKELANAALACASSPTSACANEFLSRAATELQPSGGSRLTWIKVTISATCKRGNSLCLESMYVNRGPRRKFRQQ